MSYSNKKNYSAKDKISTSKSENNSSGIFEFYARIVKLIILRKDNVDVVSKCSTWLAALRRHRDADVRVDYVKLLLMALDRGEPTARPFDEYPPDAIDPVDGDWTAKARSMFRRDAATGRAPPPPLATAVSDDKRQFAAYQPVPGGAGMQCYYARSDRPLHEWSFRAGSASGPPDDWPAAVQAVPLDWERSLAGMRRKGRDEPSAVRKYDNNVDYCKILDTYQEIINLGEAKFKWNDKSLLTGDIIPGSDLCIDWSINEHEKTQLELDEEMVRSFDKLYPDNFRLIVRSELLEGIVQGMDHADKNARTMADECEQVLRETRATRQCAGRDPSRCSVYTRISSPDEHPTSTPAGPVDRCRGPSAGISTERRALPETIPPAEKPDGGRPVPRSKIERCDDDDDANECLMGLPSSARVGGESFNAIVNEAENIISAVNDWLATKDLM